MKFMTGVRGRHSLIDTDAEYGYVDSKDIDNLQFMPIILSDGILNVNSNDEGYVINKTHMDMFSPVYFGAADYFDDI